MNRVLRPGVRARQCGPRLARSTLAAAVALALAAPLQAQQVLRPAQQEAMPSDRAPASTGEPTWAGRWVQSVQQKVNSLLSGSSQPAKAAPTAPAAATATPVPSATLAPTAAEPVPAPPVITAATAAAVDAPPASSGLPKEPMLESVGAKASAVGSRALALAESAGLAGPVLRPAPVLLKTELFLNLQQSIDLLQAWKAALVNDPSLRAARAALAGARERLPQARSQLLPQVQLGVSRFGNQLVREGQNSLSQPLTITDRYLSANDTLSLRQPLFRPQQYFGVVQADAAIREAEAIFAKELADVASRVSMAYFDVLLAQDTLQLIESQRQFLETALAAAKAALLGGTGTRTDIDTAQARLDLNTAQMLQIRQQREFARRQLQTLVNRPFGELKAVDPTRMMATPLVLASLDDWLQKVEAGSPEIQRLRAQKDALQLELNKAKSGHLPTVDLVAQVQRSRSENTVSPQSQYQNASMGVQINVPLYSGGYVNSVTRQVSAEIERVGEVMEAVRLDLGVRVHKEYRGVVEGQARIQALETAVRSAEVALDSMQKSARAGVRTQVDIFNAEQQRAQAVRDLAEARYSVLVSLVRLESLGATGDEDLMTRLNAALAH